MYNVLYEFQARASKCQAEQMKVTDYVGRDEFPFEAYIQHESHALSRELLRKTGIPSDTHMSSDPHQSIIFLFGPSHTAEYY